MKQDYRIMDSDMHVLEPHDLWLERLPEAFRERAPRIERLPGGGSFTWSCDGRFYPAFTDHPKRRALNKERYDQSHEKFRRYDEARSRRFDAKSQLDAMDVEGIDVAVTIKQVPATFRGWIHGPGNEGIIKLIADRGDGILVGATSMGPHGGEVLSMLTVAIYARVPLATLQHMIYAYPTFNGGVGETLGAYARGIGKVMDPGATPEVFDMAG